MAGSLSVCNMMRRVARSTLPINAARRGKAAARHLFLIFPSYFS